MKVIQLLPELNEGGVERGVVETNREFQKLGHKSHVVSAGGHMAETIKIDGGCHYTLDICSKNIISAPSRILKLRKLLNSVNPEIIHARSRIPAWLSHFANRKSRRPFVTTVHGLNSVNGYSKIMTSGDRVICVSEVIRDYIMQHYHISPKVIRVVQRGVDMDQFSPEKVDREKVSSLRSKLGLDGKFIVTSVGRITWLKDYETFIQSMARVCKNTPEAVGLIVGGYRKDKAEYFNSLKKIVSDLKMENHILFAGNQEDMLSVYALSDIIVNASLKMGNMGRTVVEALALGKPVMATTFKGLHNLIENEKNGRIIATRDINDLTDSLLIAMKTPYREDAIRSSIPAEYTLHHMVESILSVYREIV